MQGNSEINTTQKKDDISNNDEIDLFSIFNILLRNKRFISQITLISFIGGIFYSFSLRKIWEGQFQIVLTQKNTATIDTTSVLDGLSLGDFNLPTNEDPLKTEVEILKSPLVLNKVFNYVKKEKANNKNNISDITFKNWKNDSLNIDLEKGTSILNLSYRDTNKELIIPVLDKISKSYQDYSGRNRSRRINLGITFLENQIEKYKIKSPKSAREAQEFALQEDLAILKGESELDKEIPNQINIEAIRISSGNKIRNIEMQLKLMEDINDPEKLINVVKFDPEILDINLLGELREIESNIKFKKSIYKENDIAIQSLLKKRDILIQVFKEQAINLLKARKLSEKAILKASDRPKGVIIKYRELLAIAKRDQQTLENLELNYRNLLLEKARTEDPWELISSPTLLNYPVSPNKKNIVISSFLFGILLSSILSLIIEKRKRIIFSSNELLKQFNYPLITELSNINEKIFEEELKLLLESSYLKNQKKIIFIKESKLEEPYNSKLEEIIKSKNCKIQNLDEFFNTNESNDVIFMPILGKIKLDEIKKNFNKLELLGIKIIGIVPIKENNYESGGIKLNDELIRFMEFIISRFNSTIKNLNFKKNNS